MFIMVNTKIKRLLTISLLLVPFLIFAAPVHAQTYEEKQQWCETNYPDSEFEECMWNRWGIDVTTNQRFSGVTNAAPTCGDGTKGVEVSFDVNPATVEVENCLVYDEDNATLEENPIFTIIGRIIQFLLASIGVALVIVVALAGVQYTTARGDPQKVASAKKKIFFAVTAVIMYALSGALLNWLIPGGII
jgi:hypothetical protein